MFEEALNIDIVSSHIFNYLFWLAILNLLESLARTR